LKLFFAHWLLVLFCFVEFLPPLKLPKSILNFYNRITQKHSVASAFRLASVPYTILEGGYISG